MGLSYSGAITVVSGGFNTNTNTPPAWATTAGSLGSATGGNPFSYNLSATDADGNTVTYRLSNGSLPAGLSMNSAGQISGTVVNNPGTYNFSVIASDGTIDILRDFSITVTNTTPTWTTAGGALTIAHRNVAYSTTVVAADANYDTVTYSLFSGTLPTGITLNGTTGQLSGTPTVENTFSFVLRADDGHGATADRSFSIEVTNDSPVWQSPNATLSGPYTQNSAISAITLVATDANGDAVTFALQASTLPTGLTLSGSQITGTPTGYGTGLSFTIRASDVGGAYVDRTFTMDIIQSDPFAASVKLLYNLDGNVTDSSAAAHNGSLEFDPYWSNVSRQFSFDSTSASSGVIRNTTEYKFGSGSLSPRLLGCLSMAASNDFNFSSSNCTIECWIYVPNTTFHNPSGFGIFIDFENSQTTGPSSGGYHGYPRLYWDHSASTVNLTMAGTGPNLVSGVVSKGAWHHIALVKNGGTTSLYIDGSFASSTSITWPTTNTFPIKIGGTLNDNGTHPGGTNGFAGYVDEVRISNTARYTTGFTPSASAFTSDANTIALLHMDTDSFVDSSSYARTVTLVAYTTFIDHSNNNKVFTAQNTDYTTNNGATLSSSTKKFGANALSVSTNKYLTAIDETDSTLQFGTGDFTIEFWVYFTGSTASKGVMGNYVSGNIGWDFETDGSGKMTFYTSSNGTNYYDATSTTALSANTWYHIALTRSSYGVRFYINGTVQTPTGTFVSNPSLSLYPSTAPFRIGNTYGAGMTGFIDDIRITKGYDRYKGNSFTASGNPAVNQFKYSSPTFVAGKWNQGYQSLTAEKNGGGTVGAGYIKVPYHTDFNLTSATEFTYEMWANLQNNTADSYYLLSFGKITDPQLSGFGEQYGLYYDHSTQKLIFEWYNGSGFSDTGTGSTTAVNLYNAWKHIAISNTASNFGIYVDGNRVYSRGSKITNITANSTAEALHIGEFISPARFGRWGWHGLIDDVRFTRAGRYSAATLTVPTGAY